MHTPPSPRQRIIIITAPSGSGKTTLVKRLLERCPALSFSISACTRVPRNGELHGKDYYFLTESEFKQKIDEDAFVEWEMVYTGKYYGTLRSEIQRIWDGGHAPLVDIDVQGALAIARQFPDNALTIFIKAPSMEELRNRLINRGTETPHTLEERISKAEYESAFAAQFQQIIINDDLQKATDDLCEAVSRFLGRDDAPAAESEEDTQ